MSIPHSGNECSGLCRPPCGHEGCWQCVKIVEVEAEKAVQVAQAKAAKAAKTLAAATIRPGRTTTTSTASATYSEVQTTTITRAALQGLIDQVPGLSMDWNGGDPIVIRKQPEGLAGRKLNDVHGDWVPEGGVLAQAVAQIAAGANATIDQMVQDALKGPTPEVLSIQGIPGIHKQVNAMTAMREEVERIARAKAEKQESEARDILKAQGASDEDIAAATALLGWAPPKPQQFITDDMIQTATVDITSIIEAWKPTRILYITCNGLTLGEFTDVE